MTGLPPANPEVSWTVHGLLRWATADFSRLELPDARLSAELLLCKAVGTDRVGLYLKLEQPVGETERARFREWIARRRSGEPVAYLLSEKEFYGLRLAVDRRVLIPRPETEILVDEALAYLRARSQDGGCVCDVGTGSGAIAVALKKSLPEVHVCAVDIDPEALALARENAEAHGANIRFLESDLLDAVAEPVKILVANLPYVAREELDALPIQVRDFEPRRALDGGVGGLELIERLVTQVEKRRDVEALFLEFGEGQSEQVSRRLREFFSDVRIRKDLAGIPRVGIATGRKDVP